MVYQEVHFQNSSLFKFHYISYSPGTSKPLNHIMLKDYNMKRIKSIVVEKLPEVTVTCEAVVLDFIGSDGTLKLQDLTKCLNVRSVSPKIPGDIKQHLAVSQ